MQDLRLIPAYAKIDEGNIKLLSLDIFDTLAWRKVPEPKDLFLLLGRILKKEGWLIDSVDAECFQALRIEAEQSAKEIKGRHEDRVTAEVNLEEIYWNMHAVFKQISIEEMVQGKRGIINDADLNEVIQIEIDLQKKFLKLNDEIIKLIQHAYNKQIPVVLISNTYFNEDQIRFLLDDKCLLSMISRLFISSEIGLSKQEGLFEYMLKELNMDSKSVLHVGDNISFDVELPNLIGFSTVFYQKFGDEFQRVVDEEWPRKQAVDISRQLDDQEGDFGLTFMRSLLLNDISLKNLSGNEAFFWKYGASILGPILTAFTEWIYARCEAMQENQVWCLMREGHIYKDLINRYAPHFPSHQLQANELWLSRRYLLVAAIQKASYDELRSLMYRNPATPYSVKEFTSFIGVDIQKDSKLAPYAYMKLENIPEAETFRDDLIEHLLQNHLEQIYTYAKEKRERLFTYLKKLIDLSKIKRLTLVDVGWAGSSQGCLQAILSQEGFPINVHGLYLATETKARSAYLQGFVREGFLMNSGFPTEMEHAIHLAHAVIEQLTSPEYGPMLDISPKGEIILGSFKTNSEQAKQAAIAQKGMFAFCDLAGKFKDNGILKWDLKSASLLNQLRHIWMRSAIVPTANEAQAFSSWTRDIASGKEELNDLGRDFYHDRFIAYLSPCNVFEESKGGWPALFLAKFDADQTKAGAAFILQRLPKNAFLSHDDIKVEFFVDKRDGFDLYPTRTLILKSNANRLFFGSTLFWYADEPILGIKIQFCTEKRIKINSLRIRLQSKLFENSIEKIHFEEGLESYQSELSYAFDEKQIYSVEVRICFCI